jgi:hypothetical protein
MGETSPSASLAPGATGTESGGCWPRPAPPTPLWPRSATIGRVDRVFRFMVLFRPALPDLDRPSRLMDLTRSHLWDQT